MGLQRRGALTARHAGELAREIDARLAGARVRDVQSLPPRDVLIALEDARGLARVLLAADPEAPRVHLVRERVRAHKGPVGPFFRRLEAELPGRRVAAVRQVDGDRIVRVDLEPAEDAEIAALLCELAGRHANLVLLDRDDRVLDVLVPAPAPDGGAPRLAAGRPWIAPPGRPPADPGPALEQAFALDGAPDLGDAPLSRRVELVLGSFAAEARRAALARELGARIKRRRKTVERTLAGLDERRRAAAEAERVRRDGELLKAAQGRIRRGATSIELEDWFEPGAPPRRIELEARLAPQENVERLFQRYRKLVRDADSIAEEAARAARALERLDALERDAERPDADLEELDAQAVKEGLLAPRQDAAVAAAAPARREPAAPRLPYRAFRARSGAEVLVGRSARDNDVLSIKIGRGSDVWLHTADAPGSHVVLVLDKHREPDPDEVLDAAHLAVHFSPLRGARRAQIHVARCKDVKKPKGAKPGLVLLSGGRTLSLRVEEDRLRRLLEPRR